MTETEYHDVLEENARLQEYIEQLQKALKSTIAMYEAMYDFDEVFRELGASKK
jgi:uncharacterized membrane protein